MVNAPEATGGNDENVDIGQWGTMSDVEPNYDRQENNDTIEQGASEQSKAEGADALLQKAKEVARSSKAEEEDDDEPVFDEK